MATILQIENYNGSTTIDLTSLAGISVLANDLERGLSYRGEGLFTETYTFRVTGSTKAVARDNANAFIAQLREAIYWCDDYLDSEEAFLRMAADGESAVRRLVKGFEARAITRMPGLDPFQSSGINIYIRVAFTLQDRNEEQALTTATKGTETGPGAGGTKLTLSGLENSAPSSISTSFDSALSGSQLTKLWVGLQRRTGTDFQHIWPLDYGSADNDTTETTTSGSYGTNVKLTTFVNSDMERRAYMPLDTMYSALGVGSNLQHAKGRYFGLLRYKTTGSGTFLMRAGISYYYDSIAYAEPRLLDDSGNWRFAPIGVFQFPPHGIKTANDVSYAYGNVTISIDAQRLSGTANLYYDYILWIPHDHFLALENAKLELSRTLSIDTSYDLITTAKTLLGGATLGFCTISESNNWHVPPPGAGGVLQMVFAGERDAQQVATDDLDILNIYVHEAFEAYNV